jgi:putative ABC transport system permease protein
VTVLGVMPAGFQFPNRTTEFWRPIALDAAKPLRGAHYLAVAGRLRRGVTVEQADVEMKAIAARLATEYPASNAGESADVVAMHEEVVGSARRALLTLFAAVGLVLVIACANVASLLLVRASIRQRDIAIRSALGAGRRRLIAQMLSESIVLAAAGGALGLLLAFIALDPIRTLGAQSIPRATDIGLDGRVLLFTLAASLVTGLIFGLAPAWHASGIGARGAIRDAGRWSSGSTGRRLRSGLIVAEVALSIVLLVGATLLLRSFARLTGVDPGFRSDGVLTFQIALPRARFPADANRVAFVDALLERLHTPPGVQAAGMTQTLPLRGDYRLGFTVVGRPPAPPGQELSASYRVVTPDYFKALGIPLRRGRPIARDDTSRAPMVAVVDESFVRRYFAGEDPMGHRLAIGNGPDGVYAIVGVVGDVRYGSLETDPDLIWNLIRARPRPPDQVTSGTGGCGGGRSEGDLHAPVLLASRFGRVVRDRIVLAVAAHLEGVAVGQRLREHLVDGVGALLGQREAVLVRPEVVGEAEDPDRRGDVLALDVGGDGPHPRDRRGVELGAVLAEQHVRLEGVGDL